MRAQLLAVAKRHPRTAAAAASLLLVGIFDVTVRLTGEAEQEVAASTSRTEVKATSTSTTTTTTTTTTAPPPPVTGPPTTAPPTTVAPAPSPSLPSGWPTASSTGATNTSALTEWTGSCVLSTANQVIENKIFNCSLEIDANGVTIRNSIVRTDDDWGIDVLPTAGAAAVIEDVTIETVSGCNPHADALGTGNYHATRVKVVNFGVAFWAEGNNTIVRDSYAKLCDMTADGWATSGIVGEGVTSAAAGRPYIFDHNTFEQRCRDWSTFIDDPENGGSGNRNHQGCDTYANVRWLDAGNGLQLTNNLFRGGRYAISIESGSGHTVAGNVVERDSYAYGPVAECIGVGTWDNNWEATVSEAGEASELTPLRCDG